METTPGLKVNFFLILTLLGLGSSVSLQVWRKHSRVCSFVYKCTVLKFSTQLEMDKIYHYHRKQHSTGYDYSDVSMRLYLNFVTDKPKI